MSEKVCLALYILGEASFSQKWSELRGKGKERYDIKWIWQCNLIINPN